MAKFLPLHEITQMTDNERRFLQNGCGICEGYYDPEHGDFVVRRNH